MGSRYDVEVTVGCAWGLNNVNWRNGPLKPYVVLWIDDGAKVSTRVDIHNGQSPSWDEKLLLPLPPSSRIQDAVLYVDVVHANAAKPLVGYVCLPLRLRNVVDASGRKASRNLRLNLPSGRPEGTIDLRVAIRKRLSRNYNSGATPVRFPATTGYSGPGAMVSSGGTYSGYGGGAVHRAYGVGASRGHSATPSARRAHSGGAVHRAHGVGASGGHSAAPSARRAHSGGDVHRAYGVGASGGHSAAPSAQRAHSGGAMHRAHGVGASGSHSVAPSSRHGHSSAPAYGAMQTARATTYRSDVYSSCSIQYVDHTKKKQAMGTRAGLAVGGLTGMVGGLTMAGGTSHLEDKFEYGDDDDDGDDEDGDDDDDDDDDVGVGDDDEDGGHDDGNDDDDDDDDDDEDNDVGVGDDDDDDGYGDGGDDGEDDDDYE